MNRVLALATLILLLAAVPATAAPSLDAYTGTGAWVDIYDPATLYEDPWTATATMRAHGARTLYIETANWRQNAATDIVRRTATAAFVDAAHANGMHVVAWYLPGLFDLKTDLRRSLAAIDFVTPLGGRFDSFALDIESSQVRRLTARNKAVITLSRRIRKAAGPEYPLGAIVPDQRSSNVSPALWPAFPYAALRPYYDVVLPMAYSTVRAKGGPAVYRYIANNMAFIRAKTLDPAVPIHVIGGVAPRLKKAEAMAVARAAADNGALGASFYAWAESGTAEYAAMASLTPVPAPAPALPRPAPPAPSPRK